jgi:tRNA-2-methylthio-N6-dimethylallyladenosine synthase
MNKADSEYIANHLEQAGYCRVEVAQDAEIVLLNSCVVRENAELKVANKLNSLRGLKKKSPDVTIALTGCMVDSRTEDLKKRFPWVDIFFRPQQWEPLYQWTDRRRVSGSGDAADFAASLHRPVTAFVPVIHGCNNFCSYCVVPYRRGRARSRELSEICSQVQELVKCGVREVTLLGQIVDLYGYDLPSRPDLADLLKELNKTEGLLRIRFLTNHPNHMSHRLIQAVANLEKVCEHINLPIQAGDSEILSLMRRGYTVEQYCGLVAQIRSCIPHVSLSTDIIVGFPGETAEQFARTMDLVRQLRFDKVHVAAYSPRPDTIASRRLDDNIPAEEKGLRRLQVESLQEYIAAEINADFVGETVEVLVEGLKKDKWQGRTRGDKLVFFPGRADPVGRLVRIRIDKISPFALQGMPEEDS